MNRGYSLATETKLSEILSEFASTMLTDFPIQAILDRLVLRIVDVLPITSAGVTLISPNAGPHHVAASSRAALHFEQLQTDIGDGPCVAAYQSDLAVEVPDLGADRRFPAFADAALAAGLSAVFTFPLRHGDSRLGALDLYRDSTGPLSADAMGTAQTLADVAAAYLVNAEARARLTETSAQDRHASLHDPLTGLPNRVLLVERINDALARADRSAAASVAVVFIDIDHLKAVNDNYGHGVGDELLQAIAARLGDNLRLGDTLARLAGDEFVVCEDVADRAETTAFLARINAVLRVPFVCSGTTITVSASIGAAFRGHSARGAEQLLADADAAMYQTKRAAARRRRASDAPEGLTAVSDRDRFAGMLRDLVQGCDRLTQAAGELPSPNLAFEFDQTSRYLHQALVVFAQIVESAQGGG